MPDPVRGGGAYDPENGRGETRPGHKPAYSRSGSWDVLAGIRKFEHDYSEFDSRNASQSHLAFAEGDIPKNKFSRLYNYLLNVSIVTRWAIFILPVMALVWIPGILGLTTFPHAEIWGVRLVFWSIWLSIVWGGWWAALATARVLPRIARATVGIVAVGSRRYIDWLDVLHRYVALFAWTLAIWITFNSIINNNDGDGSDRERSVISFIAKLLFAIYICAAVLAFEKFSIQWIAGKFHERSYAERIADQKFAIKVLTILYRHSADIPGRSDTLRDGPLDKRATINPRRFFKRALRGVRYAATTTTTALGNVASEMAGSSVLQPNSPEAKVKTALESANKSRLLARRLFYSFVKPGHDYLEVQDIARFFPTPEDADAAFALFDKDGNGDASRDEVELACMDYHREQLSIEHSMRDLDSAVGRLDNIFMSLYVVVAALIVAVALDTQLTTLVTGAGTLILGLSWLIGSSAQEVLTSIIFLFIKHPFDVGDRVDIDKASYTVKEIRLLTTVFADGKGCQVLAPNTILNGKFILNIRRSGQMSETFEFDVDYSTTFEQLEQLRDKMLTFVKEERRDYQPVFDVTVADIGDQEKMTCQADIKYKSNWQQGAVKARRRNKWICALKTALADCHIYGPKGNPDAIPAPSRITLVPWDKVERDDEAKLATQQPDDKEAGPEMPKGGWNLTDKNAELAGDSEDVWGEGDEVHMTNPRRGVSTKSTSTVRSQPPAAPPNFPLPPPPMPVATPPEERDATTPRAQEFTRQP
ncbi:hypothetical protein GLOTRDRAFT_74415 [Gloeophyllum trabeum ATCC 11539]|uniref:EF-hand domain-containing protein n=1 Tax=Gloeophyllum trabeum (strain ATCC 11539 / FP-39264 / Madison 617) TaxID=670483 RepID=S7QE29_GLOTA|nr:uncharacterized protein GLOTRDRAFT_74415 [Gloeophyllum trabeum ATCC 11539]EPQ57543.1 hypothetical protein GLOTRDRAFT_74415 [Gloeophyllum trabeum ATCC 11539]